MDSRCSRSRKRPHGIRVSAHVPDGGKQQAERRYQARYAARCMVAPLWQGITIIAGRNHQGGKAGQIVIITAVMLHSGEGDS